MKKSKTMIVLIGTSMLLFSFENGAKAQEIKIGTQTWTTKNLDVSTFRNGDAIPEVKTDADWKAAGNEGKPAWCYYNNDPVNGKKYGKLYNWYAANDPRGLVPNGWHVPTDAEWTILTEYLGEAEAGTKMKNTTGWSTYGSGNGTNSSGFEALPGGSRNQEGTFEGIDKYNSWWATTEYDTYSAWFRSANAKYNDVYKTNLEKRYGMSIRCIAD